MITSPANERIRAARKLHRKQNRRKRGRLLIEGVRLIEDALRSGTVPEEVFYAPESVAQRQDAGVLLQTLQARSVPCIAVSVQVLASLAETVTPQGIVAVVALPDVLAPVHPSLTLILDGVGDPGNAGTLLRSAEAAGARLSHLRPGRRRRLQ